MEQNLDVDEIWRALKPWGRYQVKQMLFMWAAQIPCAFHLLAVVFIGFQPKSECADVSLPDNDIRNASVSSVTYGACSVTIFSNQSNSSSTITSCPNGYRYDEHDKISFATEWGLLCGESTKVDLSQSLMLLGQGLGGFLCTVISDKLGRKPVHIVSHISIFILCLTTSFIPSYVGFAILRFFTGVAIEGLMLSSITMYVETLPEEWRFCSEVMGLVWWTTGIVLLTPLALLMQNYSWRYLQLLLSLLSVYSLAEYWLFDESLRWLMANGRLEEAEKVLRKAAEMNKKTFDNIIGDVKKKMAELETLDGGLEKTEILFTEPDVVIVAYNPRNTDVIKYSMLTILKDRMILLNSVIIWFIWVTNSLTYYGLSLMSTTLYGNRFLNFFFLGAMEYLSALAEFSLLNRIGRRKTLFFLLGTAGVSLLVATIMFMFKGESSVLGHLYMFFVLVGKFGISGSFSSSFLYTSELYPTNMRYFPQSHLLMTYTGQLPPSESSWSCLTAKDINMSPSLMKRNYWQLQMKTLVIWNGLMKMTGEMIKIGALVDIVVFFQVAENVHVVRSLNIMLKITYLLYVHAFHNTVTLTWCVKIKQCWKQHTLHLCGIYDKKDGLHRC